MNCARMFSLIQLNMPRRSRPMSMRKKTRSAKSIFSANLSNFQKIMMRINTPTNIIHRGISARKSMLFTTVCFESDKVCSFL